VKVKPRHISFGFNFFQSLCYIRFAHVSPAFGLCVIKLPQILAWRYNNCMSDDTSKIPAQDMTSTDTDTDTDNSDKKDENPQIFDITPDLNIAPAKDDVDNSKPVVIPDNILGVEMQTTKTTPATEEKIVPTQPEFGPANPPAKTIGVISELTKKIQEEQVVQKSEPSSLQSAVSEIKISPKIFQPAKEAVNVNKDNAYKPIAERPWEAKADSTIKPLRTYETDFAEAMAKKRISKASFVIAEDKKRVMDKKTEEMGIENSTVPVPNPTKMPSKEEIFRDANMSDEKTKPTNRHLTKNWLLSIVSLILICGGAFAGYYLYLRSPVAPIDTKQIQNAIPNFANSLIDTKQKITLNIDNKNQNGILTLIKNETSKKQDEKTIKEIILTKTQGTEVGKVSANEMLDISEITTPDLFERSLSSTWMLGVYAGQNDIKHPFIIITNDFFQNAFAGMIQWEKTMADDLKQYIYTSDISNDESNSGIRGQFKDKIIKNKDVREYVAENGHIIFLYAFVSNDKLVITNSEEALEEIVTRLEKSAFVR